MGAPEGVGGGGGGEESSSISCLLRNSGAPSALKHKSSSLYTLFHSVIYNSVVEFLNAFGKCFFNLDEKNILLFIIQDKDNYYS